MLRVFFVQLLSLDGMIAGNQFDTMTLYETLEDLKIFEADRDLDGIEQTVDLLG